MQSFLQSSARAFVFAASICCLGGSADGAVHRVSESGFWTVVLPPPLGGQTIVPVPRHLQDVLAIAQAGDEIWVAAGTYSPDKGSNVTAGDRGASFGLRTGVSILGGFFGNETAAEQRNPTANPTILSGDIGVPGQHGDNSYSVVSAIGVNNTAILDGFTVTRGQASAPVLGFGGLGGGAYVSTGQGPTIRDCTFADNFALGGAGIAAYNTTGIVIENCLFTRGNANNRGGAIDLTASTNASIIECAFDDNVGHHGGALYANEGSGGSVKRSRFLRNASVNGGGAFFAGFSAMTVSECVFMKNECRQFQFFQTSWDGGAVKNWCTASKFINCLFVSNSANGQGGALFDGGPSGSSASIVNCTFYDNFSRDGGTIAATVPHTPTLVNSILWGNRRQDGTSVSTQGDVIASFSAMEQTGATSGISTADPMFADPDGPDDVIGTLDDDFRLSAVSPYIDAGSLAAIPVGTTTDLAGGVRVLDGDGFGAALPDLGAYEYIAAPPPPCFGDSDGNRVVNFNDITTVLANLGSSGPLGDADLSGTVNFADVAMVLASLGSNCEPS